MLGARTATLARRFADDVDRGGGVSHVVGHGWLGSCRFPGNVSRGSIVAARFLLVVACDASLPGAVW